MDESTLRILMDMRDRTLQKTRVGLGNRLAAIENGTDTADADTKAMLTRWFEQFGALEEQCEEDIAAQTADSVIVDAMTLVKGVGKIFAAKLVAAIDIERADTVSALWRYAGYAVIAGERERLVKGEKAHFNTRLKTACYLISSSFLKSESPYRATYDSAREYYDANRPDWVKGRKHLAAMRKVTKLFLAHLWEVWRTIEGLPTRAAYVHEKLGHTHVQKPEDFGWPSGAVLDALREARAAQKADQPDSAATRAAVETARVTLKAHKKEERAAAKITKANDPKVALRKALRQATPEQLAAMQALVATANSEETAPPNE